MAKKVKSKKKLKIPQKYFTYEGLPDANYGMAMDPGPRMPGGLKIPGITDPQPSLPQGPVPIGSIDTDKIQPGAFLDQSQLRPPKPELNKPGVNYGDAALLGLSAFDTLLPNPYPRQTVVQPQMGYNANPYGNGSQAIMADGGTVEPEPLPLYKPKDTVIASLKDSRKINPATGKPFKNKGGKSVNVDQSHIKRIVSHAKAMGVDPYTALAISLQETNLGQTDTNYGHVLGKSDAWGLYPDLPEEEQGAAVLAKTLKDKLEYAKKLGYDKKGEAFALQSYNGYGNLYPSTEAGYHGGDQSAFYEIPVSKQKPLRLAKNPAYGKTVISLRDEVIKNNQTINDLIQSTPAYGMKNGGIIPDNMSPFSPHEYANGGGIGNLQPSTVRDSQGYAANRTGRYKYSDSDPRNAQMMASLDYTPNYYDANIPNPGYQSLNLEKQPTNFSASYRDVNSPSKQRSIYFDTQNQWQDFVGTGALSITDTKQSDGRASATGYRTMKDGGKLNASKAKEMLKDGTANGKKLTKKQKQYFGMVAAGKAAAGDVLEGDPVPKPGVLPGNAKINLDARRLQNSSIDQDALVADRLGEILTHNYNPFSTGFKNDFSRYGGDQFARDAGVRIKSLQSDSAYGSLTPEQKLERLYQVGATGETEFDKFLQKTKSLGGSPSAYYQNNPATRSAPTLRFEDGGVMYNDGGQIDTMWGGEANMESFNPYDGGMVEFSGDSHAQGGIGMQYNGNSVEVEGGEFASRDPQGNLNIYGNMLIPGSKTKFKQAAKAIAKKEKNYDRLTTKGSELVNNSNPASKWEQMSFNAGKVMMEGGTMGQKDLAGKKEQLASIQNAMLQMAEANNLDPFEMSKGNMKKAKKGAKVPSYAVGGTDTDGNDPTRADRNRNPGNIKYGKFAQKYGARKDKDGFAIFPNVNSGLQAMKDLLGSKSYNDLSVKDAIHKWTAGQPYRYDLGDVSNKKVSQLSPQEFEAVIGTMRKGEGTIYGVAPRPAPRPGSNTPAVQMPPFTPYELPNLPINPPEVPGTPGEVNPPYDQLTPVTRPKIPSNVEPLNINQVLPEIFAAATNNVEPVPAQRYEPQLYTPYQVSFQDRINANNATYNAQARSVGAGNPAALGTLGAQNYAGNSNVYADEFRTNQGIANDITNKNIALVNDANLKNLGIADTQMVRQSQARSNTRALDQTIVNSLSSKYAQNDLENKKLAAYENLYDYRFVPQDDGGLSATYYGPNAMFNYQGANQNNNNNVSRTISRYDANGNLKGYAEYEDSDLKEMQRQLDIETKRRKLPLLPLQPLGK